MSVRHFAIAFGMSALILPGSPGLAGAQEGAASVPSQEMAPPPMNQVVISLEATELLDAALAGATLEDVALTAKPYFFPALQGGTLTMHGFEVGKAGLMFGLDAFATPAPGAPAGEVAKMELFGALLQGGTEVSRLGGPFSLARASGDAETSGVHSFGDTLAAGSYELVWGVRDTVSGLAATRRAAFDVPDLANAGLATSSVMVVIGAPGQAMGNFQPNTVYEGVRVLTATFPESLDRELDRAGEIMLIYIVSGAQFDAATQGFNLEIGYRVLDDGGESIWRVPTQPLNRPTVGQPIPLSQVEGLEAGGQYSFEISVKDLVNGAETQTLVPFRVAG